MREINDQRKLNARGLLLALLALLFVSWQIAGSAHAADLEAHESGAVCHVCHAHDRVASPPVILVFAPLVTQHEQATGASLVVSADAARPIPSARGPPALPYLQS